MVQSRTPTRRPSSRSVILVTVAALLVGVLGVVGTSHAAALTTQQVKKIAAKVVKTKAKKLTVKNAKKLGGKAPAAYLNRYYTVTLAPAVGVDDTEQVLPSVPPGTYLVTLNVSAETTDSGAAFECSLIRGPDYLMVSRGSRYGPGLVINDSAIVTMTKASTRIACYPSTGDITVPQPGEFGPSKLTFTRLDAGTHLGTGTPIDL